MGTQLQRDAGQLHTTAATSKISRQAVFPLLLLPINNATTNHFPRSVQSQTRKTTGWCYRLLISTALTIGTADLKALCTTLRQETPDHRSVNTDDLLHTFSGLFTTVLRPSRQMSINKHYSDTRETNNEGHLNKRRQSTSQRNRKQQQKQEGEQRECISSFSSKLLIADSLFFGSQALRNMEQHCFSSGGYQACSPLSLLSAEIGIVDYTGGKRSSLMHTQTSDLYALSSCLFLFLLPLQVHTDTDTHIS